MADGEELKAGAPADGPPEAMTRGKPTGQNGPSLTRARVEATTEAGRPIQGNGRWWRAEGQDSVDALSEAMTERAAIGPKEAADAQPEANADADTIGTRERGLGNAGRRAMWRL